MSSDIAVQVEHLSKCYQLYDRPHQRLLQMLWHGRKQYYREFWALNDVSFEVKKGETVGIIGRNGSGKSTLLQLICGTLNPTGGTVSTQGRVAALLELGAGFNPEFTGRENVYMNASILGLTHDEIDSRFDAIAAFADIGQFLEQPVKTYSSGMYVRLAFAVIAHVDADILIIDEALSVGDAFFTQKCMRFLRNFMGKGTVLFVSHDTGAVINLCERAIWLDKGTSQFQGEPKKAAELYLEELYAAQQKTQEAGQIAALQETGGGAEIHGDQAEKAKKRSPSDMRLPYINLTQYRNDIELFAFNINNSSFGAGGGTILSVSLNTQEGDPLTWIIGGEFIVLRILCEAHAILTNPIVGFYVNDRLGQALFGDNTCNFSLNKPLQLAVGEKFEAQFHFRMPILPVGEYTITVALAEGTQQEHVQHHWIHDALSFKSHTSSVASGLIGIPMENISFIKI